MGVSIRSKDEFLSILEIRCVFLDLRTFIECFDASSRVLCSEGIFLNLKR
jgi:hypothetical protein